MMRYHYGSMGVAEGVIMLVFFVAALALAVLALLQLRKLGGSPFAQILWVLIVLLIPVVGSAACLIVKPGEEKLPPPPPAA